MAEPSRLGTGAAVVDTSGGAWVYLPETSSGVLGVAVTWADRAGAPSVGVIVDGAEDDPEISRLAAVAATFTAPHVTIWRATGRSLEAVAGLLSDIPLPPACTDQVAKLRSASLDVVADHGVWIGEINGLEVARVGERVESGECSIDIGVGAFDQFASAAIDPERDDVESLIVVSERVRPFRVAGASPHPIGRLVRSRWLRAQVVRDPGLVGLDAFEPIPLLEPRPGLNEIQPAVGVGRVGDEIVAVVFSAGPDLALVEALAGVVARVTVARVLVVLPERDRHPRIERAVEAFGVPGSVHPLEGDWTD